MEEAKKLIAELRQLMKKNDGESIKRANDIMEWFKNQSSDVQKVLDDFLVDDMDFVGSFLEDTRKKVIAEQMDGDLKQLIPLSYIAKCYFKKSAGWLSQRINGTPVRGRTYTLNAEQKKTFNRAVRDIAKIIGSFQIA